MNNETQDSLTLFFHNKSSACQKLKDVLPSDKKIQFVDIEQLISIPAEIKSIPALVVNNNTVLLGKKVYDYFTKSDEMECHVFGGKKSCSIFSQLDDSTSYLDSGSYFSSLDSPTIDKGIPEWNEDNNNDKMVDIDKLQAERATMLQDFKKPE